MSLYTEIEKFGNYFNSLRVHENLIIMDLILPIEWEVEKVLHTSGSKTQLKVGNTTDKQKIISFYAVFNEPDTLQLLSEVHNIIQWNKDIEEKNNLLSQKIIELKKIFIENSVDSLRGLDINFNNSENKLHGEEFNKMVGAGNFKGPERHPTT